MKIELALALVICGTILIAVPPASDYLHNEQVTRIFIQKEGAGSVTLGAPMGDDYRLGCWLVGAAMIGVAVIASLAGGRRRAEPAAGETEAAGRAPEGPGTAR